MPGPLLSRHCGAGSCRPRSRRCARQEHDEGIHHALISVSVTMSPLAIWRPMGQHGFSFLAGHALQQAGRHGNQRTVLGRTSCEGIRFAIVNRHSASAGRLARQALDGIDQPHLGRRTGLRDDLRPVLHLAMVFDISSEMKVPPKPITAAKTNSMPTFRPLAVRNLLTPAGWSPR